MSDTEDEETIKLPDSSEVFVNEESGGELILISTNHMSKTDSKEVTELIKNYRPDIVAVEFDPFRLDQVLDKRHNPEKYEGSQFPISALLKRKVGVKEWFIGRSFGGLQSSIANRLGLGISDMDMVSSIDTAVENDISVALIDRDVRHTFSRISSETSFLEFTKLTAGLGIAYVSLMLKDKEELEEELVEDGEDLTTEDLEEITTKLGDMSPTIKRVIIDERDTYLARNLHTLLNDGNTIIAVIGAGHKPGVMKHLQDPSLISPDTNAIPIVNTLDNPNL